MKKLLPIIVLLLFIGNDMFAQVWTQKKPMGDTLKRVSMPGFSIGDTGYIVTGVDTFNYQSSTHTYNDMWAYDPVSDTWSQKNSFPGAGRSAASAAVIGTKAYVGLGWNGSSYLNDFYEYDQTTGSWTQKTSFPGSGTRNSFCAAVNNYVFVGGGNGSNQLWVYDTFLNSWSQLSNLPFGSRNGGVAFATDTFIYFGLGHDSNSDYNDFWKYNPMTQTWTQLPNFPGTGRLQASAVKVGSKVIVGGGHRLGIAARLNDFYEFDPSSDSWSNSPTNCPVGRSMSGSFTINGKGYLVGGVGVTDTIMSNNYEISYLPTDLDERNYLQNSEYLNVYPIPTSSNQVTFDISQNAQLLLYNIEGKLLQNSRLLIGKQLVDLPENNGLVIYQIIGRTINKQGVISVVD